MDPPETGLPNVGILLDAAATLEAKGYAIRMAAAKQPAAPPRAYDAIRDVFTETPPLLQEDGMENSEPPVPPPTTATPRFSMPTGSKRNFMNEMPAGTLAPGTGPRSWRTLTPTAETQSLYNMWREALERSSQDVTQIPPSDQSQVMNGQRGRFRPLSEVTRRKAALHRKLGVCGECRERRVSCTHFDFSLFESQYQESKRLYDNSWAKNTARGRVNPTDVGHPVPETDSGYASAPPRDPCLNAAVAGASGERNSDSQTVISAGTVIAQAVAQNSISELCNDVYARVQQHVGADNQNLLFDALPDLIKAFALRLAQIDPSHTNRGIMHFVYSRNSAIACQLRQLFQTQSQDEDAPDRGSQDGMSVAEKMAMWASKPHNLDTTPATSERFEGVPDDPDYGRTILQSKAYEWFIQRLLKESSFYWCHGPPMNMVHEIRRDILGGLSKGRISKRRDLHIHRAEFIVSFPKLRRRLLWENLRWAATTGSPKDLSAVAVLVGSPDDCLLASTVGEYVDQIWGDNREVLTKLHATLEREVTDISIDSDIPKRAEAGSGPSVPYTLHMSAEGISYSIAEQGEQLAWLIAALQDPGDHEFIVSRPSVVKEDTENTWEIRANPTPGSIGKLGGLSILNALHCLGTLIAPVIAQGFPTIRRPPSAWIGKGIEISPNLLARLFTGSAEALHSRDAVLELVDEERGMCLWHAVGTQASCQCPRAQGPRIPKDIQQYRHIVDICPGTNGNDGEPSAAPRTAETRLQDVSTQESPASGSSNVATLDYQDSSSDCPETSLESEMMSIPDSPETPADDIPAALSQVVDAVVRRLIQEFREGAYRVLPNPRMTAPGETLRSSPSDPAGDPGVASVRTRPGQGEAGQDAAPGQVGHPSASDATRNDTRPPIRHGGRKRTGPDDNEDEDGNDGSGITRPPKRPRRDPGPPFACPFLIFDPVRHRHCLKADKLSEVNRVKQHLTRKHTEPDIFCDRCKAIFRSRDEHERHLREDNVTCVFKPWDSGDRLIDQRQQRELSKKSKPAPEPERWFAVWHILFPGHPRPASPYYKDVASSDLRIFREYARGRGRALLRQELQAADASRQTDVSLSEEAQELYSLSAVHRAVDAVIESFLSSWSPLRRSVPPSAANRGSGRSEVSGRETASSSFADSGVGLASNYRVLWPVGHGPSSSTGPVDPEPRSFLDASQFVPNVSVAAHAIAPPGGAFQLHDRIDNVPEAPFSGRSNEGDVPSWPIPAHGVVDNNQVDFSMPLDGPGHTLGWEAFDLDLESGLSLPLDSDPAGIFFEE